MATAKEKASAGLLRMSGDSISALLVLSIYPWYASLNLVGREVNEHFFISWRCSPKLMGVFA